jgi:hypothetical protein
MESVVLDKSWQNRSPPLSLLGPTVAGIANPATGTIDDGIVLRLVGNYFRRWSTTADSSCGELAHLELGAHFLDLRGLLFKAGSEGLYFFLLLRNRGLEVAL